jgi:DNA-directed RNA polymerase sigma subunit (sigma70/sigma32)
MEIRDTVRDFYDTLTDRQLAIFCLSFGYNARGITLTLTEIAKALNTKVPTVFQANEQIIYKLSQPQFRPLLEQLGNYDSSSNRL